MANTILIFTHIIVFNVKMAEKYDKILTNYRYFTNQGYDIDISKKPISNVPIWYCYRYTFYFYYYVFLYVLCVFYCVLPMGNKRWWWWWWYRYRLYIDNILDILTHLYDTIRYDTVYLTCSKKLTGSQLSPPHKQKIKMWN